MGWVIARLSSPESSARSPRRQEQEGDQGANVPAPAPGEPRVGASVSAWGIGSPALTRDARRRVRLQSGGPAADKTGQLDIDPILIRGSKDVLLEHPGGEALAGSELSDHRPVLGRVRTPLAERCGGAEARRKARGSWRVYSRSIRISWIDQKRPCVSPVWTILMKRPRVGLGRRSRVIGRWGGSTRTGLPQLFPSAET